MTDSLDGVTGRRYPHRDDEEVRVARPTEIDQIPSVDEICAWLGTRPALDEVANELRRLRVLATDLGQVIELLRQHGLAALGEHPPSYADHEPF